MGGTIGVESEPGRGSEFSVAIPYAVAGAETVIEKGQDLSGLKVLVACELEEMREILTRYLVHAKADVTATGACNETVPLAMGALAGGKPFDIVVVEPGLSPEMRDSIRAAIQMMPGLLNT